MSVMTDENLALMAEPSVNEVVPRWVARYLTCWHFRGISRYRSFGEEGLIFDKPGFEIDFLNSSVSWSRQRTPPLHCADAGKGILAVVPEWSDSHIGPGDTAFLQPDTGYELAPAMSGEAAYTALKIK